MDLIIPVRAIPADRCRIRTRATRRTSSHAIPPSASAMCHLTLSDLRPVAERFGERDPCERPAGASTRRPPFPDFARGDEVDADCCDRAARVRRAWHLDHAEPCRQRERRRRAPRTKRPVRHGSNADGSAHWRARYEAFECLSSPGRSAKRSFERCATALTSRTSDATGQQRSFGRRSDSHAFQYSVEVGRRRMRFSMLAPIRASESRTVRRSSYLQVDGNWLGS